MPNRNKLLTRLLNATLVPLVALVLIFEEWGWEPLSRFLSRMARLPVWGQIERLIARLPPYAALLTFFTPVVVLIPIKMLAWYWVAQGHAFLGLAVVAIAKIVGTAMLARLFTLTQPALMKLPWFASLYTRWKNWKDRMIAHVHDMPQWRAFIVRRRLLGRQVRRVLTFLMGVFRAP